MKVLITGGAGFIGQHLARLLVDRGDTVIALDSLHDQVHADGEAAAARFPGEVVRGDVADPAAWTAVGAFDGLVHLAAETGTAQSMYERDRYHRVNVVGTQLAARVASQQAASFVSLSSRAVYGEGIVLDAPASETNGDTGADGRLKPSHEDDPHQPVSFYGETKSEAERVAAAESSSIPLTIIRPQNVIGPGQALHNPYTGVLAAFLARLREERPLSIYGDGTQTRDFVHVEDLAALILWALDHAPEPGKPRVVNCGTGVRTTLVQLAEHAVAASPVDVPIEHVPVHRAGDIDHACADLSRLRALGAPLPRHTTGEAVADFITASWAEEAAPSGVWDDALRELSERGLAEGA